MTETSVLSAPLDRPRTILIAGTLLDPAVTYARTSERAGAQDTVIFDWNAAPEPRGVLGWAQWLAERIVASGYAHRIVGHSSGALMSLLVASLVPEHVAGVLIANTGPSASGHSDPDLPKRVRGEWGRAFVERHIDRCFVKPIDVETRERLIAYAERCPLDSTIAAFATLRAIDLTERLPAVRTPVCIVHGVLDPVRPPSNARALLAGLPDARLLWADAGHTPPLEDERTWFEGLDLI